MSQQLRRRPDPASCSHRWGLILGFMTRTNVPEAALCCMLCDTFDTSLWEGGVLSYANNLDVGNGVVVNGRNHNAVDLVIVPVEIYVRQSVSFSPRSGGAASADTYTEIEVCSWWRPPPELRAAQVIDAEDGTVRDLDQGRA